MSLTGIEMLETVIEELRAERDELRAALKEVLFHGRDIQPELYDKHEHLIKNPTSSE